MATKNRYGFPEADSNGRTKLTITSAEDAWNLLEHANGSEKFPEHIDIVFDGWPSFEMNIKGKDWVGTVPTRVMGPFLELQKDVHRAYVQVKYGSDNLKRLKEEERDFLELVVKVDEGSSEFFASISDQLTEIAKSAVGKMSSQDVVKTILGIAVVLGGVEVSKSWIASRQAEVSAEQTVKLSEQETARMKIFADAMKSTPILEEVKIDREETQNRILKSLKPTDSIKIPGMELKGAEAAEITQQERARSTDIEINGVFRILANDVSKASGFRIKLERISDSSVLSADVPIELPDDQKSLLQQAEWSKGVKHVVLSISATELRGKIGNAAIVSVIAHP